MITSHSLRTTLPFAKALGSAFLFGALALGAGCNSTPFQAPTPQPEGQADKFYEVNPNRDLDLLFMIDNSGSMQQEQDKLKKNFPALIASLRAIPGGLPNVHIGIVSSDVGAGPTSIDGNIPCNRSGGDKGELQVKAGCGLDPAKGSFLIALNNDTMNNFTGKLEDVFSCMADLGTGGCGFEHQLQSVRVALAEQFTPKNAGFLRPDAFLAIVLITDEDDCSGKPESDLYVDQSFEGMAPSLRCNMVGHLCEGKTLPNAEYMTTLEKCVAAPDGGKRLIPVNDFTNFILGLKPNQSKRIIVSAITGTPAKVEGTPYALVRPKDKSGNPLPLDIAAVCSAGAAGTAAPSLRIAEFVKGFGENGTMDSICDDDFTKALKRIGDLIAARLDPGCIKEKLIDTDTKTAGVQGECAVVDRVPNNTAPGAFDDKVLPECGKGAAPCWKLQAPGEMGNACAAPQLRVFVDRAGKEAPKGTIQSVKCRTCALADDPRCN